MIESLWFFLLAGMFVAFVVLDGFDWGVGVVQPILCKTEGQRAQGQKTIGPFWDGNEVWLVAAGGTLFFAFPRLYALSFSGFYLPLMMLLWVFILRAMALELRHQGHHPLWCRFWDALFAFSSFTIAFVFGAALGNLIRGLPLGVDGQFFVALWTDFLPTSEQVGVLDIYTVSVGLLAVMTLGVHGCCWLALKQRGELQVRALNLAKKWVIYVGIFDVIITVFTLWVQPLFLASLVASKWLIVFPLAAFAAWYLLSQALNQARGLAAFVASCSHISFLLLTCFVCMYPIGLIHVNGSGPHLYINDLAAPASSLIFALKWWIPGLLLAISYFVFVHRMFKGPMDLDEELG